MDPDLWMHRAGVDDPGYRTAYARSYYYSNVVDKPMNDLRVTRKCPKYLLLKDPVANDLYKSVHQEAYDAKYRDHYKPQDSMPRFSFVDKQPMKSMSEKFARDPVKRIESWRTTTGLAYPAPEVTREAGGLARGGPIEEALRDGSAQFPRTMPMARGYLKLLDNYLTTARLAHPRFPVAEENVLGRKDVLEDVLKNPSRRALRPKTALFGRIRPRSIPRVPNYGKTSEYAEKYDQLAVNASPMEIQFPTILPISRHEVFATPEMYRTETSRIGSR